MPVVDSDVEPSRERVRRRANEFATPTGAAEAGGGVPAKKPLEKFFSGGRDTQKRKCVIVAPEDLSDVFLCSCV